MHPQLDVNRRQSPVQPLLSALGVGTGVTGHMDDVRSDLVDEVGDLVGGVTGADGELAAALADRGPEIGEALGQEACAIGPVVVAGEDAVIENEDGDHAIGLGRGGEHRVVRHAQISGKQRHRGMHTTSRTIGSPRRLADAAVRTGRSRGAGPWKNRSR